MRTPGTAIDQVQRLASAWKVSPFSCPCSTRSARCSSMAGRSRAYASRSRACRSGAASCACSQKTSGELQTISGTLVGRDRPRSWRIVAGSRGCDRGRGAGRACRQALARQVWFPSGDALIAAWVSTPIRAAPDRQRRCDRTILAGDDGRVLERYSLVDDAAFDYSVYGETTGELHPLDGPQVDFSPHPTGTPDGIVSRVSAGAQRVHVEA